MVAVRMERDLKEKAEIEFKKLGFTPTEIIQQLYKEAISLSASAFKPIGGGTTSESGKWINFTLIGDLWSKVKAALIKEKS